MIEYLNDIDTSLLLFLNGLHAPYFDNLFWLITSKLAWIPMICVLLFCMFRRNWRVGVAIVLAVALTITLCDQVSSGLIKDAVCRLRPSRNPELDGLVHLVNGYRSGMYGFVSSHAANSFGVAMLLALFFGDKRFTVTIFMWAVILSYSRIYLGVHYPGDILCGGLLGCALGVFVYWLYGKVQQQKRLGLEIASVTKRKDAQLLTYATVGNFALLIVAAMII